MDRRKFLQSLALTGSYFLFIEKHAAEAITHPQSDALAHPDLGFFNSLERTALGKLCDHVVPGAVKLGSVTYIETLLVAFESNPPKIYAGGPFSGRGAPPDSEPRRNDFAEFIPLNRYQEAAWRLYLYGESGVPGGSPNRKKLGPVKGLRDVIGEGVARTSRQIPESGMVTKVIPISTLFSMLEPDCREAIRTLTIEACYSAPEYGGNRDLEGWRGVHFPGDLSPHGYSHFDLATQTYREDPEAPVSRATPGTDPDPLTLGPKLVFRLLSVLLNGRSYY